MQSSLPRQTRLPRIDTERCTGCGRCVAICPAHVLWLEVLNWRKFSTLHTPQRCTGCGHCAVVCPFDAISMPRPGTP